MPSLDQAPLLEPITPKLGVSWTRWFNQVYSVVSSFASSIASLTASIGALNANLTTLATNGTLTNPTLNGGTISNAVWQNGTLAAPTLNYPTINNATFTNGGATNLTLATPTLNYPTINNPTIAGAVTLPSWGSWTPSAVGSGSMTASITAITNAEYLTVGSLTWFSLYITLTTAGTASAEIDISLPVASAAAMQLMVGYGIVLLNTSSGWQNGVVFLQAQTAKILFRLNAMANFPLGSQQVMITGVYRIA